MNMDYKENIDIVLASKSPRRSELLTQIGVKFRIIPSCKEEIITKSNPSDIVIELSAQKAWDIYEKNTFSKDTLIIGADTIVAYDNEILGKPHDKVEAKKMLLLLSGKKHQVYTGVTVIYKTGGIVRHFSLVECTEVSVYNLNDEDIETYIESGEPMDKAGAYGIQGLFAKYVQQISGDYNNVVGLPVSRLFQSIRDKFGVNIMTGQRFPSNEIQACIFDLDGTVLDTVESIGITANKVLTELNLKPHQIEQYKKFAGDGQIELIKRALRAAGDENNSLFEQAMQRYIELFKDGCRFHVKPYEGIRELFSELKKRNIKITIFSNKEHNNVVSILDDIFGKQYFDCILGQKSDHKKKPSGEGIDIILNQLGVKPDQCLYIGDTSTDMMTGKNYGLYTIGVTWGFRSVQELINGNADYIVNHPKEIIQLIDKSNH